MTNWEKEEYLCSEMVRNGFKHLPSLICFESTRFQRFSSNGKRGDKAGWYKYFPESDSCVYGDFRTGQKFFCDFKREEYKPFDFHQQAKRIMEEIRSEKKRHDKEKSAAISANKIFHASRPASPNHPYLIKKHVRPHGARETSDGSLVIPVIGEQGIQSLQIIDPLGNKRFLSGAKAMKGWFVFKNEDSNIVFLVEGFATGASAFEQTGIITIAAFSANNLPWVAKKFRDTYPGKRIIILADNDESGTGLRAAQEAEKQANVEYVLIPGVGRDANDFVNDGESILNLIRS